MGKDTNLSSVEGQDSITNISIPIAAHHRSMFLDQPIDRGRIEEENSELQRIF